MHINFYFPMDETGERRGRGKSRNKSRGLRGTDNGVGRAGESN